MKAFFKNFVFTMMALGLSGIFVFVLLEITLRFFPVTEPMFVMPVSQEQPIHKFQPNRTITWSRDWNFSIVNQIHINNDGFVNNQDYVTESDQPLIAVIGDSFVESVMVPYPETLQGRMEKHFQGTKRVYSFGASGAPLSQYLAYAAYVRDKYKPEKMIFVIVGNDFDESWPEYKTPYTFHHFIAENGEYTPQLLNEYHPTAWKNILRKSAVFRYLHTNLQFYLVLERLKTQLLEQGGAQGAKVYVGNVAASVDEQREQKSFLAIDAFLKLLPEYTGLKPSDITLVVDAARHKIYEHGVYNIEGDSYFEKMRARTIREAMRQGFDVLDTGIPFAAAYAQDQKKFEFPTDGHWNGYAHGVVFNALYPSP